MSVSRLNILPVVLLLGAVSPPLMAASEHDDFEAFMAEQGRGMQAQEQDFDAYRQAIEQGFDDYQAAYEEAFELYKQQISKQWGEFLEGGPKIWVSYAEDSEIRRVVDFEQGQAQVSLLVDKGTMVDEVSTRLSSAVYKLLNSTQADAFEVDAVAQRLESRLDESAGMIKKGTPSQQRIFSLADLTAVHFDNNPFRKVSNQTNSAPVQWEVTASMTGDKDVISANFVIPNSVQDKAERFAEDVTRAAVKERLPPELILAVIETESSFNPMARSHIPAYGLMQIVPRTAGRDATQHLYGESKILAPSYLYEIDKNIRVGSAYLHVLYYRYMRKVTDPVSRLYCAIAAYNTGASNVGYAFTGKKSFSGAVKTINSMTAEQVYAVLVKDLPYEETQKYVKKVAQRMEKYVKVDG